MNWYAYVGSDPVNGSDPSGLREREGGGYKPTDPTFTEGHGGGDIVITAPICHACASALSFLDEMRIRDILASIAEAVASNNEIIVTATKPKKRPVAPAKPQNEIGCKGSATSPTPVAWTPNGETKGNNPVLQGNRYNTDLPGGSEAAMAVFIGLSRLDGARNGGDGGFTTAGPFRPTTLLISNTGNVALRMGTINDIFALRIDIKSGTFDLNKSETIHFNGDRRGDMCPTT